jgi:hypothetical protein
VLIVSFCSLKAALLLAKIFGKALVSKRSY